ncbi:MAG: agmatinase [Bacillota bacterium]|jgi:agmatinase|nr:agmatinase [Bacillota bacterium]MDK2882240.1 agmatinase [Bacillota bacterium]MDK2959960.1 agmatinase [Bacillota bacterium]
MLKLEEVTAQNARFLAAQADLDQAKVVLLGVPLDVTVSYRPGTRRGPTAIRQASWNLEEFSLYQERDLGTVPFADAGDLALPAGGLERSLNLITQAAHSLVETGKVPLFLGGEHLLTLGTVRALVQEYPDLAVVQLDAHADLRSEYEGEELSHATVMRRIADFLPPERIYQFGIRSATQEEVEFARARTRFFPRELETPLRRLRAELTDRPLYLSIDLDVFDPAFAPGVGTPEPGGVSVHEALAALGLLKGLRVVGIDIVEACPPFDPSERTAALAALLVRELVLHWAMEDYGEK